MNTATAPALPADDPHALTGGLKFATPLADLAEFSELPERRRNEVSMLLPLLGRVHALLGERSLQAACEVVAATSRHLMRGLSHQSLRRKYEAFRDSTTDEFPVGNWRVLVAGYRGPNKQPREFQMEIKRVSQLNQCSVGEAMQALRERWAAGEAIDGCGRTLPDGTAEPGTWLELYQQRFPLRPLPKVWPRGFYPTGWSVRNLRRYGSPRGARVLYARGLAAAQKHFPSTRYDTSKLRPLELITIDDFELDCLCAFAGDAEHKPQIGRVAGLLAIDVATRRKLHWGLGQRLERHEEQPDGTMKTVRTGIGRIDVQFLLHALFAKFGLPPYQVTLLVENAAAAISPELELSITTLFGGRVRIERTGLVEHRNLTNGFVERGGKPMEKGWIEAAIHGLWNIMGGTRGYKGNNQRLNAPGDLDEKIRMTKMFFGQGERALNLPPEKIALLRLPFAGIAELERTFARACALADARDNHKYLGFDRVTEVLLEEGGEPQPFTALALLAPEAQLQAKVIERMESPVERWARLTAGVEFAAIEPSVLAVFLLTPKRVTYRDSAITFVHDRRGKRTGFSFVDTEGTVLRDIAEGTDFLGYFDPAAPDRLHITQLNGARTGTLTRLGGRTGVVDVQDKAARAQAAAIRSALINRVKAENAALHAETNILLGAEREHNAAIVAAHQAETAGLSTAQKLALAAGESAAQAHAQKQAVRRDEDLAAQAEEALSQNYLPPQPGA